ncbi:monovalent cation/H+ antiporter complex subunit F [Geoglobus acetivorans]|uniref:Cation:proton antiporter n=1 Tax=Geoglobus acetivorans TaxID=565033 RepID=A0A0A7GCE2_GEOAI|nr:monovalent cation/H+ antiporter subunit F [Geoglobus acetivorans]MBE8540376.1 cation:proton antiporter [Geoglobus acetivorans]
MEMLDVFLAVGILITVSILMTMYRVFRGPTTLDRLMATSVIGTKVVVLLVVIGYLFERPIFVDIPLTYAMLNFVGTLIVAKYIERGELWKPYT